MLGIWQASVLATSSREGRACSGRLSLRLTASNIVQRLGGPTLTTICATFLGWRLSAISGPASLSDGFIAAFALLSALHSALCITTLRLPAVLPDSGAHGRS